MGLGFSRSATLLVNAALTLNKIKADSCGSNPHLWRVPRIRIVTVFSPGRGSTSFTNTHVTDLDHAGTLFISLFLAANTKHVLLSNADIV